MLKILITAFLQARLGWTRARQVARMTNELRMLSRGRVYHYPGERRTRDRLTRLYEGQE
jgi:hypothetical protein